MLDAQQEWRIAQGLREGRTDAWQALYDAYAERVWRSVARLLGPASDIADVVQETMMAAARSARGFNPERGSLWQWLAGIAHNQALLHLRKRDQRQRLLDAAATCAASGQILGRLENKEPSPPDALASAELAALVRAALTQLVPDYALLLTIRYLDGDTVAQIAQAERSTETAVRSRLARARQAFREVFAQHVHPSAVHAKEAEHESPR